jgi:hypothetical protein
MGIKIHEYANEAFQINDEDFYDVDYWNGASYETRKISGATLKAELSGGGGGGRFGIADTNGVYTYYTTLTAAMTAAVSGQTIEMFADYTETGAVTITLKDGVTINGNGHTYNVTNVGASDVFESTAAGIYRIYNLIVNRINATGGSILNAKNNVNSIHYFDGCYFTTNSTGITASGIGLTRQQFYNANITITGSGSGFNGSSTSTQLFNFKIVGTSISTGRCVLGGVMYNSSFEHFGTGVITCSTFNAYNCTIISNTSGTAASDFFAYNCLIIGKGSGNVTSQGYNLSNCTIYSTGGVCMSFINGIVNNCSIYSTANYAIAGSGTDSYYNCSIYSGANTAAYGSTKLYNCTLTSTANVVIYNNAGIVQNCSIECTWNNSGGHGFRTDVTTVPVKDCSIKVTNSSANCLYASSAISVKYAQNSFEGATTPVNANITQGMVNIEDAQGNITI